jgi:hypothetical protein
MACNNGAADRALVSGRRNNHNSAPQCVIERLLKQDLFFR